MNVTALLVIGSILWLSRFNALLPSPDNSGRMVYALPDSGKSAFPQDVRRSILCRQRVRTNHSHSGIGGCVGGQARSRFSRISTTTKLLVHAVCNLHDSAPIRWTCKPTI